MLPMKNRKTLSIFVYTFLLSTCFIIKTENPHNLTKEELLDRIALHATIPPLSILMASSLCNNKGIIVGSSIIFQTIALELTNDTNPKTNYLKKLGKKRFISNIASIMGAYIGLTICPNNLLGHLTGLSVGGAICGAGSDYLLAKLFSKKIHP